MFFSGFSVLTHHSFKENLGKQLGLPLQVLMSSSSLGSFVLCQMPLKECLGGYSQLPRKRNCICSGFYVVVFSW